MNELIDEWKNVPVIIGTFFMVGDSQGDLESVETDHLLHSFANQ